jgi:hypothetical protein
MTSPYAPLQVTVSTPPVMTATAVTTGPQGPPGPAGPTGATGAAGPPGAPGVQWYNVKTQYGGDNTGAADSTTAIQNAMNAAATAGGGIVYLPAGSYKISSSLILNGWNNVTISGDGQATFIKPTTGVAFSITGGNANRISNLMIQFASTTTSANPVGNTIGIAHSTNFEISNVEILYANGWALTITSDATGDSFYPVVDRFHSYYCNGGMYCIGTASPDGMMGVFITNCKFDYCQTNVGINLLNVWDAQITNIDGSGNLLGMVRVTGLGGAVVMNNVDFGVAPAASFGLLIEPSGGNVPVDVMVSNSLIQQGKYPLQITGGKQVTFSNCVFQQAASVGAQLQGTLTDQVTFSNCIFASNGSTAAPNNYDLNWSGSGNISVIGCMFSSPIGTAAGQVVKSTTFTAGTSLVMGCTFAGGQGNGFATYPTYSVGHSGDSLSNLQTVIASKLTVTGNLATFVSGVVFTPSTAGAGSIANGGTITTAGVSSTRFAPAAAVTGIIMNPGTVDGQSLAVINEGAGSITFAASGSNVADGASDVIPASHASRFIWSTRVALWFRI